MKGKIVKRSLALGALMAFVITGSTMAAELAIDTTTDCNATDFNYITYRGNKGNIYYFDNNTADTITISGDITSNFNVQFAGEAVNGNNQTSTIQQLTGNTINITEATLFNNTLNGAYLQNATGTVSNNKIYITKASSTDTNQQIAAGHAFDFVGDADNNRVENNEIYINLQDTDRLASRVIVGGYITSQNQLSNGHVLNNKIEIIGGTVGEIRAGAHQGKDGDVSGNKVFIKNATIEDEVTGAYKVYGNGNTDNNIVELENVIEGNIKHDIGVRAAYRGDDTTGNAIGNQLILKGTTVVYKAHAVTMDVAATSVGIVMNNTIILEDEANVTGELGGFGYYQNSQTPVSEASGNKLEISENWTGAGNGSANVVESTLNNVQYFDTIQIGWTDGTKELTINNFKENDKSNEATTFVVNDINTKVNIENYEKAEIVDDEGNSVEKAGATVAGTSRLTDQLDTNNVAGSLASIANNFTFTSTTTGEDGTEKKENVGITKVSSAAGTLLGASSIEVEQKADGTYDIVEDSFKQEENTSNTGVNEMTSLGLISWRAETNDMNKRLGELRNANGEHGVWVRMVRGEAEYKSIKNQYNQYQLGYDEKLSVDKRWTVGAALSYTDAENNFRNGSGESENKALAIYGSKLNDDGSFIDLIAKYGRLENDFTINGGIGDADYSTNAYSLSAEFGKRIQQGKGLWIEPQVELTYGKVSNVTYTSAAGATVAQDGMESLIGRVGFSLGKDIKQGNVYARASYLYDFDGEANATMRFGEQVVPVKQDLGGGWWEVGVGANINLSKATYIYADVEKTFGGEVDTNWQWNLGVRYSF